MYVFAVTGEDSHLQFEIASIYGQYNNIFRKLLVRLIHYDIRYTGLYRFVHFFLKSNSYLVLYLKIRLG